MVVFALRPKYGSIAHQPPVWRANIEALMAKGLELVEEVIASRRVAENAAAWMAQNGLVFCEWGAPG